MRWILVPSRGWVCMGCLVATVALSARAQAEGPFEGTPEPVAPPIAPGSSEHEPAARWDGSWALATDGAAIMFTTLGLGNGEPSLLLAGAGIYLLGAPSIHLVHSQTGKAAHSFLLRVALPVLAGVIGYQVGASTWTDDHTSDSHNDEMMAAFGGLVIGALAGAVAAVVIDDVLLARKPIQSPGFSIAFVPTTRSATLALAGRF
jgi:hypothetical protein